jgi:hypothetical protein
MTIPGFSGELALYNKAAKHYRSGVNTLVTPPSSTAVLPQMQQVKCSLNGQYICCGIEDDVAQTSTLLGCGRIMR